MFANEFVWCDLSTFDLAKACDFYGAVFGWTPHRTDDRGNDYTLLYAGSRASAGIYTMPEFFQGIGMPSFWMSYVRVESLTQSVARAVELNAKCEIEPTAFDDDSQFALIRDPCGAGFTLYEGPHLQGRDQQGRHGRMMWNELHVPSIENVEGFYRDLFDWQIVPDDSVTYRHQIQSPSGAPIASMIELDEASKGPKNYWSIIIATDDLAATLKTITKAGGEVLMQPTHGLRFAMATDNQGAMFCIAEPDGR